MYGYSRQKEAYGGEAYGGETREDAMEPNDLAYVPTVYVTKRMCEECVERDGVSLRYVPWKMRTSEMCLKAVKQNADAMMYVPEELITVEMCREAVRGNGKAVKRVPERFRADEEVCRLAVENCPSAIGDVEQTRELCEMAVRADRKAIEYVREEFKTPGMCEWVCEAPFLGVAKCIPAAMMTEEMRRKLEGFYEGRGYTKFEGKSGGDVWVDMGSCIQTFPCKHPVVLESGEAMRAMSSAKIAEKLAVVPAHLAQVHALSGGYRVLATGNDSRPQSTCLSAAYLTK